MKQLQGPTFRFYSISRFAGEVRAHVWEHGADGEILSCDFYSNKNPRDVAIWLEKRHRDLPRVEQRQAFCPQRLVA